MTAPHVGEARAIQIEGPDHIGHPCLFFYLKARDTADITVDRVGKQPAGVLGTRRDKSPGIILLAFVMAAVAIPVRATITRAPQVGIIKHAACMAMKTMTWAEMLDVIVS